MINTIWSLSSVSDGTAGSSGSFCIYKKTCNILDYFWLCYGVTEITQSKQHVDIFSIKYV
jgi:hypothetical protein